MMITNEMIQLVAEYDGMSIFQTEHDLFFKRGNGCTLENYDYHLLHLKYLTSLDWLHPVAMKLLDCLRKIEINPDSFRYFYNIKNCCGTAPIKGQYNDLFNAVYEGILFINNQKTHITI